MEISTGIIKEPHFIVIYGPDGVGKTTFAAEAPSPIIVGPESGSNRIKTTRAKNIKTMKDIRDSVKWLRAEKHDFKTLALDSLDWIEPLLWDEVCIKEGKGNSIEEFGGGFQKGYGAALSHWKTFIEQLQDLRHNREMNIIAIAHSRTMTVNDPMQQVPYDRHSIKLQDGKTSSAAALWREAVEAVLFVTFEDTVFKQNKGDKKGKVSEGGPRKIFTVRHAAYDAKNRLGLPSELPLSYKAFSEAADLGEPDSLEMVQADLIELSKLLKEDVREKMEKAVKEANEDLNKLIKFRNHARVLAGEK